MFWLACSLRKLDADQSESFSSVAAPWGSPLPERWLAVWQLSYLRLGLASQLIERKTLTYDTGNSDAESLRVLTLYAVAHRSTIYHDF